MPALVIASAMCAVVGCTGHQVRRYGPEVPAATAPAHVTVLLSDPARSFTKLGAVSVKQYKPGFSDPTVMDAEDQLKQAGAELGADAVIVRNTRNDGQSRVIYVDAEAIRYN